MNAIEIFGVQILMSLAVWAMLFYWLAVPWLKTKSKNDALFFMTIPHAFRHIGLMFLVPGVVAKPLPGTLANEAAYGDLVTGIIAIFALVALRNNWSIARATVWLFNIVGTVDLLNALSQVKGATDMGATWYIPTMLVPLLLVTHAMIFVRLLRKE